MESIQERARTLIKLAGVDTIARKGDIAHSRWLSVTYKNVRMSTEELEVIKKVYPQYAYWLITGEIIPEAGQTSPEYDLANEKLDKPAGA
jgi:hypothetical protein|nr:hypothetical protein [Marinobacter lutaoensis]